MESPMHDTPWIIDLHRLETPARELLSALADYKGLSPREVAQGMILENLNTLTHRVRSPASVEREIDNFGHAWAAEQFISKLTQHYQSLPGQLDEATVSRLVDMQEHLSRLIARAHSNRPSSDLMHTPLSDIVPLDRRALNLLRSHDIVTVKDVMTYSEVGLAKLQGVGENTVRQIKDGLARVGLDLHGTR